jgi:hypothetical protein
MNTLVTIARNSLLVSLSALGILIGIGMLGYSLLSGPPSRDSLHVVEGTISEASRVTRKRKRTGSMESYYEMNLKQPGGAGDLKLRVPTIEMAESDVRSVIGRPVKAEFDTEKDVYVLKSGNREILTFENSLERRKLSFRQYYVDGIAAVIAGTVLLLIGLVLGYRKLRREAAVTGGAPAGEQ